MTQNKVKISITIDSDLYERIEQVREARGDDRSSTIERMLRCEIDHEEAYLRDMENPVLRTLLSALMRSDAVATALAAVAGETLSPDELQRLRLGLDKQAELGKERAALRKSKRGATPAIE